MNIVRRLTGAALVFVISALMACGGGGGGDTGSANCTGTGTVTVSGTATFEDILAVDGSGGATRLDYSNPVSKPIREAEVRIECADGSKTFAETTTDTSGDFSASVPQNVDARIVVRARSVKSTTPGWNFAVVDNTNGQSVWAMEGESFNTGTGNVSVDIEAGSGWSVNSYEGERIGGAFSIYDTVYEATNLVIGVDSSVKFSKLLLNWSPDNTSSCSDDYPYPTGCIGTSFYTGGEIYILGMADEDTDEYDDSVVAHEWGHYYEDTQSRSDSVGGSHGGGEVLEIRIAFGEAWGNALSGMVIGDTKYRDTRSTSQASGFSIGLESETTINEGWFNETSLQLVIFDIFDSSNEFSDSLSAGFAPIHAVLSSQQKNTPAFTSIFPFITYLKANGVSATALDNILAENKITGSIIDEWGSGRVNKSPSDGAPGVLAAVDPVYVDVTTEANSGANINVCYTDEYKDDMSGSAYNKLGARRYLKFEVGTPGTYEFLLDGRGQPITGTSDPDMYLYDFGSSNDDLFGFTGADYSSSNDPNENPDFTDHNVSKEFASADLTASTQYVMDAHEWLNHDSDASTGGDGCMTLTIELQ